MFLNKGPLLEIRDVAAQAGLGYGTVYHYFSNKGDLLHDLLWDALDRAGIGLDTPPAAAPGKTPPAGGQYVRDAALNTGSLHAAASLSERRAAPAAASSLSCAAMAAEELGPAAAACIRLLQLWAEDHALFLLHKLAVEGFAPLPEALSGPLSAAFSREVLAPLAALLESGHEADVAGPSSGNAAQPHDRLQRAEMLLAALVGCASISLRRGKLHEEAGDIARLLKL